MNIKSNKQFQKELRQAEAIAEAVEMSNAAKDVILERMAGMYFRAEQLRKIPGYEKVTVAELVDKMPKNSPETKAVAFSWTVDYMMEAFHDIMKQDGEEVNPDIIGNLSRIEMERMQQIVKV